MIFRLPQSHWQSHAAAVPLRPARSITTRRPNRCPVRSTTLCADRVRSAMASSRTRYVRARGCQAAGPLLGRILPAQQVISRAVGIRPLRPVRRVPASGSRSSVRHNGLANNSSRSRSRISPQRIRRHGPTVIAGSPPAQGGTGRCSPPSTRPARRLPPAPAQAGTGYRRGCRRLARTPPRGPYPAAPAALGRGRRRQGGKRRRVLGRGARRGGRCLRRRGVRGVRASVRGW